MREVEIVKRIGALLILIIFLAGCNFSINFGTNDTETVSTDQKKDLTLQVTKTDEESGFSIENSDIYQQLEDFIGDNPDLGEPGQFMVFTMMPITFDDGRTQLMLLGVNRLNEEIKNIEFEITLGNGEEYIWEDLHVTLHEEDLGTLEVAHGMPFALPINEADQEILESITEETKVFKMENLTYDAGE